MDAASYVDSDGEASDSLGCVICVGENPTERSDTDMTTSEDETGPDGPGLHHLESASGSSSESCSLSSSDDSSDDRGSSSSCSSDSVRCYLLDDEAEEDLRSESEIERDEVDSASSVDEDDTDNASDNGQDREVDATTDTDGKDTGSNAKGADKVEMMDINISSAIEAITNYGSGESDMSITSIELGVALANLFRVSGYPCDDARRENGVRVLRTLMEEATSFKKGKFSSNEHGVFRTSCGFLVTIASGELDDLREIIRSMPNGYGNDNASDKGQDKGKAKVDAAKGTDGKDSVSKAKGPAKVEMVDAAISNAIAAVTRYGSGEANMSIKSVELGVAIANLLRVGQPENAGRRVLQTLMQTYPKDRSEIFKTKDGFMLQVTTDELAALREMIYNLHKTSGGIRALPVGCKGSEDDYTAYHAAYDQCSTKEISSHLQQRALGTFYVQRGNSKHVSNIDVQQSTSSMGSCHSTVPSQTLLGGGVACFGGFGHSSGAAPLPFSTPPQQAMTPIRPQVSPSSPPAAPSRCSPTVPTRLPFALHATPPPPFHATPTHPHTPSTPCPHAGVVRRGIPPWRGNLNAAPYSKCKPVTPMRAQRCPTSPPAGPSSRSPPSPGCSQLARHRMSPPPFPATPNKPSTPRCHGAVSCSATPQLRGNINAIPYWRDRDALTPDEKQKQRDEAQRRSEDARKKLHEDFQLQTERASQQLAKGHSDDE